MSSSASSPQTITAAMTITGTYKTQYQVTFNQTGISSDANSAILTAGGADKSYGANPLYQAWYDSGSNVTFDYKATVTSGTTGKQYALNSVTPNSTSPQTVNAPITFNGDYKTQYRVSFNQTGISSDAGAAIVSVEGSGKSYAANPLYQAWYDSGTSVSFTYSATVTSSTAGKQYTLNTVTPNSTSPQAVNAPITFNGDYKIQYRVTFNQTGISSDANTAIVSVEGAGKSYVANPLYQVWYDSGSNVTFTYSPTVTSSTAGKQYALNSVTPNSTSPQSVNAPITCNGDYKTQYEVTFNQTGISSDASAAIVTAGGEDKSYAANPLYQAWYDSGSNVTFVYRATVTSSSAGK